MDADTVALFKNRLYRIINKLDSSLCHSLSDIQHEIECIASAASCYSVSESARPSQLHNEECSGLTRFIGYVVQAIDCITEHSAISLTATPDFVESCPTTGGSGAVGRPAFIIPSEQLEYLVEQGFTIGQIADIVGTSKRTISRRLALYNISLKERFSDISDEELDMQIKHIISNFPNLGYRNVKGHLSSGGIIVQEGRVRESMRRVDLDGVLYRRIALKPVLRRTYNVPAPNSLWHIDGYHKLIRWRLVIHGGIDGYSRVPVFLNVSSNNRADTVLSCFLDAVAEYGLPARVRSDKGSENVAVAEFMVQNRGVGSHITGRSVHNQRIERFWRDLWTGCIMLFYSLFHHMEHTGLLNPDSEVHLQCLHFIFIPRIREHLKKFQAAYIRKPLRTAGNRTPLQLFVQGQILQCRTDDDDIDLLGVEDGAYALPDEMSRVDIPETPRNVLHHLSTIDPLAESDNYGTDLFEAAISLVHGH